MFRKASSYINKTCSRKVILWLLVATVVLEIILQILMPQFRQKASGAQLLDMLIAYTPAEAYAEISKYSGDAMIYFIFIRITDSIFPASYALLFAYLSCAVYRKKYESPDNYLWVISVPVIAGLADYIENFIIIYLVSRYPVEVNPAAYVLNIITMAKFAFILFSLLLILTGFLSNLKGGDSGLLPGNQFKGKK